MRKLRNICRYVRIIVRQSKLTSRSDHLDNCDWTVKSNDTNGFYVIIYILPKGGRSFSYLCYDSL